MTRPGVEIEGVNRLARALKKAGDEDALEALKAAHRAGADIVLNKAKTLVPVRTGALRSTLRASSTPRTSRVRAGTKRVPYVMPVHFGWRRRNIRPQPFLYDALAARDATVVAVFEDEVKDLVDRIAKDAATGSDS